MTLAIKQKSRPVGCWCHLNFSLGINFSHKKGHKMTKDVQQYDYRFMLTSLMSIYRVTDMARFKDIVAGLTQQTSNKAQELARDLEELNALRASWQRYQELSKELASKERAIKIGYALLLSAPLKVNTKGDAFANPDQQYMEDSELLVIDAADLDLSNFSLWRVIREVVRQTAEIRVFELEAHLKQFGLTKASRPAIESALATHPKEFRITKRGREKFVSLK
jgi:hypothetical protein